jgi:hypothetical protein
VQDDALRIQLEMDQQMDHTAASIAKKSLVAKYH